jgi:hypothetical protein
LYELLADPWEQDNRIDRDRAIADSLRALIDRIVGPSR